MPPSSASSPPITVAIVDDHPIVRQALRGFLHIHDDIRVVAEGDSGRAALELARDPPRVMLLDLMMAKGSGLEVVRRLKTRAPDMAVLMLSAMAADQYAVSTIADGASGYLNKHDSPDTIVAAIRTVATGKRYLPGPVAQLLLDRMVGSPGRAAEPHSELSKRELQVALRLANGEETASVAEALALSSKAVSTYRRRALNKLGLQTNSQLTRYAIQHGLLEDSGPDLKPA